MRGRGIDFEHKFNTSRWAEDLLIGSLGKRHNLLTVRYGISQIVAKDKDLTYGQTAYKEPDLLVFQLADLDADEKHYLADNDLSTADRAFFENNGKWVNLLKKAVVAIEVEFSPYKASEMDGRDYKRRTLEAWEKRQLKNATPPTAPNIWVKEEDLSKLINWELKYGVPIIVAHLFDQEAFSVRLSDVAEFQQQFEKNPENAVRLQVLGGIFTKIQDYNRVDAQGAGEKKRVFLVTPDVSVKIGNIEKVEVKAQLGISTSKKYVSHVLFSDGELTLSQDFLIFLQKVKAEFKVLA